MTSCQINNEGLKIGVYSKVKGDGTIEYSLVNKGTSTRGDWGNNIQRPIGFSDDMKDSISKSTYFVNAHKDNEITMVGQNPIPHDRKSHMESFYFVWNMKLMGNEKLLKIH